jgi:adenosylcobinamide-phosphate synthase
MSVLVAIGLDLALEEPPARIHPVVGMGRYLAAVERFVPSAPRGKSVARGAAAWSVGALGTVVAARAVERFAARVGGSWATAIRGTALWTMLSARLLFTEVRGVETALRRSEDAGRAALARVVGRETTELSPAEVRGAAIESVSENLSDSVVAPLFWYLLAGLPGAACYRFANTADACWGYRSPRWQHAGTVAARADDVLNLVPARIAAALLYGGRVRSRLRCEATKTASPNAGWPMAAVALRLDLRLTKREHYDLNPSGRDPGPDDVAAAVRTAGRAAIAAVAAAATLEHLTCRHRGGRP